MDRGKRKIRIDFLLFQLNFGGLKIVSIIQWTELVLSLHLIFHKIIIINLNFLWHSVSFLYIKKSQNPLTYIHYFKLKLWKLISTMLIQHKDWHKYKEQLEDNIFVRTVWISVKLFPVNIKKSVSYNLNYFFLHFQIIRSNHLQLVTEKFEGHENININCCRIAKMMNYILKSFLSKTNLFWYLIIFNKKFSFPT